MEKEQIVVLGRADLLEMIRTMYEAKFEGRLLDSHAAAQVLGVSISTLNRWIDRELIHPDNADGGKRVERKFSLTTLIRADVTDIKKKYRALSK